MSQIKVIYRVMAVRERQEQVDDLCKKLGEENTSIFWDENHNGSMWNAKRIWRENIPEGTTHICLLCDDADVVNNFKEAVQKCVENFPNAIWTFANRPQVTGDQRGENTPYVKIWNCWIRGICCLMPVSLIDGWFAFLEKHFADIKGWSYEDTTTSLYALLNNIDVMMPIPNLAVGKDVKSVIKGHTRLNRKRDMSCWYGRDIDLSQFDTKDYVTSKSRAYFEFHLHNDEEVLLLAKKKIDRMKKLDKLIKGR